MDARLQLRVQRYGWDKAARVYEGYWAHALAPAQRRAMELAALQPGERVLDIASGTGIIAFQAAERVGASGTVMATDISDEMVKGLRATVLARGITNVHADRMDAQQLALPDGTYDAAICALGLMYVPDPLAALREMHRALKPGGRAIVAVWGRRDRCGWAEIFPIVDRRVESEVCPMFFQLGGPGALRYTMELGGFADIRDERIDAPISYANADDAVGAAFAGGPVALAYAHFDAATRESAHGEYLDSIAAFRQGDGYRIPGEFVVASAIKR